MLLLRRLLYQDQERLASMLKRGLAGTRAYESCFSQIHIRRMTCHSPIHYHYSPSSVLRLHYKVLAVGLLWVVLTWTVRGVDVIPWWL